MVEQWQIDQLTSALCEANARIDELYQIADRQRAELAKLSGPLEKENTD